MDNIFKRANKISRLNTEYRRVDKALNEIHKIGNNRPSLEIEALEPTEDQIDRASELLQNRLCECYTELERLVKGGEL